MRVSDGSKSGGMGMEKEGADSPLGDKLGKLRVARAGKDLDASGDGGHGLTWLCRMRLGRRGRVNRYGVGFVCLCPPGQGGKGLEARRQRMGIWLSHGGGEGASKRIQSDKARRIGRSPHRTWTTTRTHTRTSQLHSQSHSHSLPHESHTRNSQRQQKID